MRFEIETVDGETLKTGGAPLMSDEKMGELYPELWEAIKKHEKDQTGLTYAAMCAQILKIYNTDIEVDKVQLDMYTCHKISLIYKGEFEIINESQEDKKKELTSTS